MDLERGGLMHLVRIKLKNLPGAPGGQFVVMQSVTAIPAARDVRGNGRKANPEATRYG